MTRQASSITLGSRGGCPVPIPVATRTAVWRRSRIPTATGGCCRRSNSACRGASKRATELPAGPDAELREHLVEVPFHVAGAQEEPRANLGIRQPLVCESRDLQLLRSQVVACRCLA